MIRAELKTDCIALRFARAAMDQAADASHHENAEQPETLQVAWQAKNGPASPQPDNADKLQQPNQATLQAITRAHRWIHALSTGEFDSIEALAENIQLHHGVLAPEIVYAVYRATDVRSRRSLREVDLLSWQKQMTLLKTGTNSECSLRPRVVRRLALRRLLDIATYR